MIDLFSAHSTLYLFSVALLGALIGSFLNVVIHRLPRMLKDAWKIECREFLSLPGEQTAGQRFNLLVPRSHCPNCQQQISSVDNIPIISYLFLRGKCRHCSHSISLRYPIIEFITLALSVLIAWQFGLSWQTVFSLLLVWSLIALIVIDLDHQLLPDHITLPLLWLGLLINLQHTFASLPDAVIGAIAGYSVLWLFTKIFYLITGKQGMGHGDFKLLAALGAWLGWQLLPLIVVLSSFVGAMIGISLVVFKQHERDKPIPFGPYLAIAGIIALCWGTQINAWYLGTLM